MPGPAAFVLECGIALVVGCWSLFVLLLETQGFANPIAAVCAGIVLSFPVFLASRWVARRARYRLVRAAGYGACGVCVLALGLALVRVPGMLGCPLPTRK